MSNFGRSNSPRCVVDFPTMSEPRQYMTVRRGQNIWVFDLYETLNKMYTTYQRYQTSHRNWIVIQAFIEELRFATEPNLNRWVSVPRPGRVPMEPLNAEDWMIAHGEQVDLIDLTNWNDEYSSDEEVLGVVELEEADEDVEISLITQEDYELDTL